MKSLITLAAALFLSACAGDPPPPKPATDYDGIRDRAHESHESLKRSEDNKPPPSDQ